VLTAWLAGVTIGAAVAVSGRPSPGVRLAALRGEPVAADASPAVPVGLGLVAATVAGSALVVLRIPVVVIAAAGAAVAAGFRIRRSRRAARDREARRAATVEITVALAAELRAGRTPAQALTAVADVAGPLRPAVTAAAAAVEVGADAASELRVAADEPGAERLIGVAAAWAVSESAGGRIAVVLERLGESMDNDDELRLELDAAMSAPRATMLLLGGLPVFGVLLGQGIGAHPLDLLLHHPLGWGLLASACVLDAIGVLVTRAIARRAVQR
jgi:tight adherence protein B